MFQNDGFIRYREHGKAYVPGVKRQVVEMAINGGGIRDTGRVLGINKNTVISTLKKASHAYTGKPYS